MLKSFLVGLLWGFPILLGFSGLYHYGNTPGLPSAPPTQWPAESQLMLAPQRPTIVLFLHPFCPCSRASLRELEKLVARLKNRATIHIVFNLPQEMQDSLKESDLWSHANRIPYTQVLIDINGQETRRFQAETSGQILVYGPDTHLKFKGGITSSRGHEGDNKGVESIMSIVLAHSVTTPETFVFGCPLFQKS